MRTGHKQFSYPGVRQRFLSERERSVPVSCREMPLVIEPINSNKAETLTEFLRENAEELTDELARYGAVLLRGFAARTIADFEHQIVGIQGIRGISEVLMSEPGRTVVDGLQFVLYTNAFVKTGGTLDFTAFHSENYYVADVPRFIFFFCLQPPWLGGETGLLNTAKLYADLPDSFKAKLENEAFWVSTTPLSVVRRRYGCSIQDLERFCAGARLPIVDFPGGAKAVVIYKPSVVIHPITGEPSLMINFGELNGHGLQEALLRAFSSDYSSMRWLIHRSYWRMPPGIKKLGPTVRNLITNPRLAWPKLYRSLLRSFQRKSAESPRYPANDMRVGDAFSREDIEILAQLIRKNYSSFKWKRGDILMVDNIKMAHAGMPGLGARELKVIISNRVEIPCAQGSGIVSPDDRSDSETLGSRLLRFSAASLERHHGSLRHSA